MEWVFDPARRIGIPNPYRWAVYAWLAAHFGRLAIWYWIEQRWGKP